VLPSDSDAGGRCRARGAGSAQQACRTQKNDVQKHSPAHYLWQFYRFLLSYLHLLYLYFYPVARVFAVSVAT
jgi:hypothetical protein